MEVIKRETKLCLSCMEEHEVLTIKVLENVTFKNEMVEFYATYEYCENTDEYFELDSLIALNDLEMKNQYRRKMNLLTVKEIENIRKQYCISQKDLAILLGWGEKTITRYEGHQVQDNAHDAILRKLSLDPEWFLSLLEGKKNLFSAFAYAKYKKAALFVFDEKEDIYLRKHLISLYARFSNDLKVSGGVFLSIDKLKDVINYLANSPKVINLYKVKLMKLLWYADNLSFKRWGRSITGLIYQAFPMGALPIGHNLITSLNGISCEEVEIHGDIGYKFNKVDSNSYDSLSKEEMSILDDVIEIFGKMPREEIVERMHQEQSYIKTSKKEVISYEYANNLSID